MWKFSNNDNIDVRKVYRQELEHKPWHKHETEDAV